MSALRLTRLGPRDALLVLAAGDLFDTPPSEEGARRFLAMPGHHLVLAIEGYRPVGFVTGVEMCHPDKGTEMFVYELAVDPAQQRRGIGSALLRELQAVATERGCHAVWTLTETDNQAALATYRALGARESNGTTMLEWDGGHATR
ncbi:GNAT family N-acetyltransferase [uncultured Arsenicicoccus sp.]|uniref:GNAT family N-acetyltransferase n=1 Tax=uncultured Arsenicicoccus sp. TaxID=491339 RepID=UPI0025971C8A|nr:GNAT family N-acetyltransferase [uncultured Arsenicicoccus sp.]